MRAMVLAAGLGTRLHPLTLERPKPAVPYGLRPLICVALDSLAQVGVRDVVVNTHHLGVELARLMREHVPVGMSVWYLNEPELLGTGGGIRNARRYLDGAEPFLVLNSDIVFQPNLQRALELHQKRGARATMLLRSDPNAKMFGGVEIDASGHVRRLLGTPDCDVDVEMFMFTGVHVLSPSVFDELPRAGCVIRGAYRHWVDAGEAVYGVVDSSPWLDLGTLERYLEGNIALTHDGNVVADSAVIDGDAVLERCIVGRRARIGPHHLRRCVVWPDAIVASDLDSAIVTPTTIVHP